MEVFVEVAAPAVATKGKSSPSDSEHRLQIKKLAQASAGIMIAMV